MNKKEINEQISGLEQYIICQNESTDIINELRSNNGEIHYDN